MMNGMRRFLFLALLVLVGGLIAFQFWRKNDANGVQENQLLSLSQPIAELLLPDIVVIRPREIFLRRTSSGRALRFSTTFINQGQGPLEIIGHTEEELNITYAAQYVQQINGPGIYRDIGTFTYHPAHRHWHIDQYVQYQLWSVKPNGEADQLLVTSNKQSFCIWDENSHDLTMEKAPKVRAYPFSCNQRTQGMSVGWSDTYRANVEGQEMNLADLSDGTYIFRSFVNPDRKILEGSYNNNENIIYLEIKGDQLTTRDSY